MLKVEYDIKMELVHRYQTVNIILMIKQLKTINRTEVAVQKLYHSKAIKAHYR